MKRARIAGMHAHMIATSNSRRDQIPTGTKSSALVSAGHVKRIPLGECTGWVGGTVESDRFYEPEDTMTVTLGGLDLFPTEEEERPTQCQQQT
jgi:hypothetical protein